MQINKLIFIFFSCGFALCCTPTKGQNYAVSGIPDSLRDNAEAVMRLDTAIYTINNLQKATYKSRQVITILSSKAQRMAQFSVYYNKLITIKNISAKIYDKSGNEVRKVKKTEIKDISDYESYSLFEDTRYKVLDLRQKSLPYTVEFEYEVEYRNLYYAPDWTVQPRKKLAVELSKFTIVAPKWLYPRYKLLQTDIKPDIFNEGDIIKTSFTFRNLPVIIPEPYGPKFRDLTARIKVAPSKFDFDGYQGDLSSWDSMAEWQRSLNKDLNNLPSETKLHVEKLVEGLETDEQKAKAIYEYMQGKTRYVSIQLGIGGFQPFASKTVDETGYGDCKALSFYTQSLLKHVGVESHYTWVYGGYNPPKVDKEFPDDTFNHIILCLPNKGDTLWLECTSQTNPFGYVGKFTGDRDVFVITDDGGKIVHTTTYEQNDNLQKRTATIQIDKEGNGTADIQTLFRGLQYENQDLDHYVTQNKEEQKSWVLRTTDIPNFQLNTFDFEIDKDIIPSVTQTMSLELTSYAQISGKRIFLPLNLMNRRKNIPSSLESRDTPVNLSLSYTDTDSIVFMLPEGIHPEYIPKPSHFESQFGVYDAEVKLEENQLIYIRKIRMNKGTFPKESYDELREFIQNIVRADKSKAVFLKST